MYSSDGNPMIVYLTPVFIYPLKIQIRYDLGLSDNISYTSIGSILLLFEIDNVRWY